MKPPSTTEGSLPERFGPYLRQEELGKGGMGVVYRARHEETGQEVALKTLRYAEAGLQRQMRREIEALAQIQHPGVVRIVEHGLHEAAPWFAMEYLQAPTLLGYMKESVHGMSASERRGALLDSEAVTFTQRELFSTALTDDSAQRATRVVETDPSPQRFLLTPSQELSLSPERPEIAGGALPLALALVRRLCQTLAHLHGEGICHRDLKPSNVLVRPGGYPVLIDFGLSQSRREPHKEQLEFHDVAGTPRYMAPETIRGGVVDARSDLYALGCILFRLLAGRAPFESRDRQNVLAGHIYDPPPSLSQFVTQVPDALEELVQKLLQKAPDDRMAYAEDVAASLAAMGAEGGFPQATPGHRSYLYRPGYTGRSEQTQALITDIQRGLEATRVVAIQGDSGLGKTRMMLEVLRAFRQEKLHILTGRCVPPQGHKPLQPLLASLGRIADLCQEHGEGLTQEFLGSRGPLLALYEPSLAELPGVGDRPPPEELPPQAAQMRLLSYLSQTFFALSRHQPVLLLLDDLQWAGPQTLDFLDFFLRTEAPQQARMCVVLAYRGEGLSGLLPSATAEHPRLHIHTLEPLEPRWIREIIARMLAHNAPPDAFVQSLARHSQGNPFFVAEYLRSALNQGLLQRDQEGTWLLQGEGLDATSPALPDSVHQLLLQRFEQLSPKARQLAALLAVWGQDADEPSLEAMGLDPALLAEGLRSLLSRRILEELRPGVFRFVNDQWREIIYGQLDGSQRKSWHQRVALGLEALGQEEALGHHWEQAQEPARAIEAHRAMARACTRRYALKEAGRAYAALLRLLPEASESRAKEALDYCRYVLQAAGQFSEARELLEPLLAQAEARDDERQQADIHYLLGECHRHLSPVPLAHDHFQRARQLYHALGDISGEARSAQRLGIVALLKSDYQGALPHLQAARHLHQQQDDLRGTAETLHAIAGLCYEQGRHEEALRHYQEALEIFRDIGLRRMVGSSLNNLATIHGLYGRHELSLQLRRESVQIRKEIGDRLGEFYALNQWSMTYIRIKQLHLARPLIHESLNLCRELNHSRGIAYCLSHLGLVHRELGAFSSAYEAIEQSLYYAQKFGDQRLIAYNYLYRGICLRLQGAYEAAITQIDQAEALFASLELEPCVLHCLCERGLLDLASGRDAQHSADQIQAFAAQLTLAPASEERLAMLDFQRAFEAQARGEPLHRGQRRQDLPEALQKDG